MKIVKVDEKEINGISTRTTNRDEMDPEKARIGILWQTFNNKVSVDYSQGKSVYGIYYNYETDANGEFSVLVGTDQKDSLTAKLENITILSGQYIVFEGKGEMPRAVVETWGKIWDYFSNDQAEYQRAYTTDFEYYKNENEVDIYIALK
ncbi:MAG: GyrI-like domain-containing protein [Candidatus Heimdallarchaeota archaeon]|nr:GyrI-like domain-containing protein [Candidatus Heimdallarchaeota archaeon]